MTPILPYLAQDSELADRVADAVCELVLRGREIGERPCALWFERLAVAVAGGVFERKTVDAIVDHILVTPAPAKREAA